MSDLELGPLRVGIVGAGRLGLAFARALAASDLEITAASSRSAEGRSRAVRVLNVPVFENAADVVMHADIIIVCVPDDAVPSIMRELAGAAGSATSSDTGMIRVVSTSGIAGASALKPLTDLGHVTCSIHPLRTVAEHSDAHALAGAPAAITTLDEAGSTFASALAHAAGMVPFDLPEQGRPLHAAAAAIAANCTVAIQGIAHDLAIAAGIPENIARVAYSSLATSALDRVGSSGAATALTGPIPRGDASSLEAQLAAIARHEPRHEAVVRALMRSTIQLAFENGRISIDDASTLSGVVAQPDPPLDAQPQADDDG